MALRFKFTDQRSTVPSFIYCILAFPSAGHQVILSGYSEYNAFESHHPIVLVTVTASRMKTSTSITLALEAKEDARWPWSNAFFFQRRRCRRTKLKGNRRRYHEPKLSHALDSLKDECLNDAYSTSKLAALIFKRTVDAMPFTAYLVTTAIASNNVPLFWESSNTDAVLRVATPVNETSLAMKTLYIIIITILGIANSLKITQDPHDDWETFKATHKKTYMDEKDESDHKYHFLMNRMFASTLGGHLNKLADLSPEEYKKLNGFRMPPKSYLLKTTRFKTASNASIPDAIDWRQHDYVTDVKDQGQCGSCWSFSSTGALEGQQKRATGKLVSLSEQNLVDCSKGYGSEGGNPGLQGCDGGIMHLAFAFIKEEGGVDSEESYPYTANDSAVCKFKTDTVGATDDGMVMVPEGVEEALKAAVATVGPISVAIDASHRSFQFAGKGVYYEPECSDQQLDHAVLVVGYGTDPVEGDFWIVKNSWGTEWADGGYIRMARNRDNHCGIASVAVYPVVKSENTPADPVEPVVSEGNYTIVIRVDFTSIVVIGFFIVFFSILLILFKGNRYVMAEHLNVFENPNFKA
ncbi:hypothetical protein QR680_014163 [Steinernema hermaphroditum]|uniref:Cathepsin L-like n=1 Tax=Steinernema hermaphroditum TaxID=289476 RepID=A0AA39I7Y2_9BILA|nr:hypothetical protein QR680_014163 [Steinernema hermaphroditum]